VPFSAALSRFLIDRKTKPTHNKPVRQQEPGMMALKQDFCKNSTCDDALPGFTSSIMHAGNADFWPAKQSSKH
jgi:hypothetical protein